MANGVPEEVEINRAMLSVPLWERLHFTGHFHGIKYKKNLPGVWGPNETDIGS